MIDNKDDIISHSIENVFSGDSFPTEITPSTKNDLKQITKRTIGILIGQRNIKTK